LKIRAAFVTAAALAALVAMSLPIKRDSDAGAAHAATPPFVLGG
jgi:hypothetical protein